jgi:putative OPT family oligopeptide transporter
VLLIVSGRQLYGIITKTQASIKPWPDEFSCIPNDRRDNRRQLLKQTVTIKSKMTETDHSNPAFPEITPKAFVLAVILSIVLSAANAYLGLFAGMTVSASIPAAVVSMGVLRLFRKSNILENNIVQTAASAGESLAAGVIFTMPALLILDFWQEFSILWVAIIAGFGGLLGVLFTIPLRRSLILQSDLKFPEGVATAEVLETGQHGKGVGCLVGAGFLGSVFKLGANGLGFWPEAVAGGARLGGSIVFFGSTLSPALLSVGYIVGLNIAVLVFLGGALNWLAVIPAYAAMQDWSVYPTGHELAGQAMGAVDFAEMLWSEKTRFLGVGAMLVGGLWTIFHMRRSLLTGILSGLKAYKGSEHSAGLKQTDKDIPMKWVLVLIAGSIVPLFAVYQIFVQDVSISLTMAVTMVVTGFIFSGVAAYMAGLVGSSNNPLSGLTIATVVVSALLFVLLMGKGAVNGPAAAIIVGSVVCCAGAIAGDNMQDLKAGQIVGATPYRQQIMQMVGTVSAALVIGPVLVLLHKAYGFAGLPGAAPDALAAPQANLMASIAEGVFGEGLPWKFVFGGMALAAGIIALDCWLVRSGSNFRTPVLAVAVGVYLPFELSVPIFAGGVVQFVASRVWAKSKNGPENTSSGGLLFASGLITGEALMGIVLAIPVVLLKQRDIDLPLWTLPYGGILGVSLLGIIVLWLYQYASDNKKDDPQT